MVMKHRIGFIGTGEIAIIHANSIRIENPEWEIAGGYDVIDSACRIFCSIYGGRIYQSVEALLQDQTIDTVYICTRHDSHVTYSEEACKNGKNIFLEKPVALNYEDARKLLKCWKQRPVPFTVGYNMRVTPSILLLKEKLEEHNAKPEAFRLNMTGTPFMQGWAGDERYGGGVLVCQGSHMFDLIAHILKSPISEICADTQWLHQPKELEPNSAIVLVKLENGVCGTLLMHDRGNKSYHIEPGGGMINFTIYSEQGTYDVDAYGRLRYGTNDELVSIIPSGQNDIEYRWGYRNEASQFSKLLASQVTSICTLDEAVNAAAVVEAAKKSVREHRWVSVVYG
ncbi:MAG: Gfo/Idh/MocA family oxidoreductase [Anaerolineaceae bacterium]|nr:MAG: Gfo/Idh/MocA family oxidoreductase [Anaerolineaceae bacterium]